MTDNIKNWLSETMDQVYMNGSARSITTGFFIAGCLWILCSELILFFFFSAPPDYLMIETLKGLLFIVVASTVVYGLSRRKMRHVHARFISERLKDALNFQKILQENLGEAVFIIDPTTRTIRPRHVDRSSDRKRTQRQGLYGNRIRRIHPLPHRPARRPACGLNAGSSLFKNRC